jgi:hypothetical protein
MPVLFLLSIDLKQRKFNLSIDTISDPKPPKETEIRRLRLNGARFGIGQGPVETIIAV